MLRLCPRATPAVLKVLLSDIRSRARSGISANTGPLTSRSKNLVASATSLPLLTSTANNSKTKNYSREDLKKGLMHLRFGIRLQFTTSDNKFSQRFEWAMLIFSFFKFCSKTSYSFIISSHFLSDAHTMILSSLRVRIFSLLQLGALPDSFIALTCSDTLSSHAFAILA
jgi:hypothetical protein